MYLFNKSTMASFFFFFQKYGCLLVTSIHYFFTLQLHKWQNSTKLSAVWRILLQWRHLSPGPWHQPAFLSVSHCLMGEGECVGRWGGFYVLYYDSHSYSVPLVPMGALCSGTALPQITKGISFSFLKNRPRWMFSSGRKSLSWRKVWCHYVQAMAQRGPERQYTILCHVTPYCGLKFLGR